MDINKIKNRIILDEISSECEECPYHEDCPESDCTLWCIEQVILAEKIETKITINDDLSKSKIKELQKNIKNNDGYCICAVEKSTDTKCPCKDFRENTICGPCNCGLYKKELILKQEDK